MQNTHAKPPPAYTRASRRRASEPAGRLGLLLLRQPIEVPIDRVERPLDVLVRKVRQPRRVNPRARHLDNVRRELREVAAVVHGRLEHDVVEGERVEPLALDDLLR